MNPNNNVYYSGGGNPKSRKRLYLVIGLIVVIVLALIAIPLVDRSGNQETPETNNGSSSGSSAIVPLSTLRKATMVHPGNMRDYTKRSDFTADIGDYTTKDNACNLQFGVVNTTELPGTTLEEIATNHLGAGEQTGATGGTPVEGDDLVLKDAESSTRYSMPTFDFEYSRDGVRYRAAYSLVLLPQGKRAFVRTYCSSSDGPVSNTSFQKINAKAKEIKIEAE